MTLKTLKNHLKKSKYDIQMTKNVFKKLYSIFLQNSMYIYQSLQIIQNIT
jgi:hypothetical protein